MSAINRPVSPARVVCVVLGVATALLLLAPAAGARAATCSQLHGRARSGLVPVWAYVNGKTPVAGARVVLMRGAGRRQRPVAGSRRRTNSFGVALLRFRRVPSHFTVLVQGGRAGRGRLPGSLELRVGCYRAGASVLEVNPLSTLVSYMVRLRPRMAPDRARSLIKRYYRIPAWADLGADIRDSRWFDAGAYLRALRRHGSVSALNQAVAIRVLRGGRAPLSDARRSQASSPLRTDGGSPKARVTAFTDKPFSQRIKEIFSSLVATTKETVKGAVVQSALGWVLNMGKLVLGIGPDPGSPEDIAEKFKLVREQLTAMGEQVTQLHGKVDSLSRAIAGSDASRLLHHSDDLLASIDHASTELAFLARMNPNDKQYNPFSATISNYIGAHLLDASKRFKHILNPALPLADNAIKATSRALGQKRFFDAHDSKLVDDVYQYFASYQTQLATLLANYWNTKPDTYTTDYTRTSLADIEANVTDTQRTSLKPAVPNHAFIDTRHPELLYYTDDQVVSAYDLLFSQSGWLTHGHWRAGGYMWMATAEQLNWLFDGAGKDPGEWLRSQLQPSPHQTYWWTTQSLRFYREKTPFGVTLKWWPDTTGDVGVRYFNVNAGKMHDYTTAGPWRQPYYDMDLWKRYGYRKPPHCGFQDPVTQRWLKGKQAALIYTRTVDVGHYWWGSPSGAATSANKRFAKIASRRTIAASGFPNPHAAAAVECKKQVEDTRGVEKVLFAPG